MRVCFDASRLLTYVLQQEAFHLAPLIASCCPDAVESFTTHSIRVWDFGPVEKNVQCKLLIVSSLTQIPKVTPLDGHMMQVNSHNCHHGASKLVTYFALDPTAALACDHVLSGSLCTS